MSELKLSDAIRLGAMLKPQAFGAAVNKHGTCAIGAACDAVGKLDAVGGGFGDFFGDSIKLFPILDVTVAHPLDTTYGIPLCSVIVNLNDGHRWSRERIADWVATVEARQAQEALQDAPGAPRRDDRPAGRADARDEALAAPSAT